MVSREENELLTRTGPGTPCGELMRRYWQPAALSEELPPGGPPVPTRLLGEDLALFRDDQGRPGLLGLHCSHRGADLSYGRLEDGGLRCIYHGWLYDLEGKCLEQPGEPAGSTFHDRIRHRAYPCREVGGIIYAYLGAGEPPLVPPYEAIWKPAEYRINTKAYQDCNFLQANEGNHDPTHVSILHGARAPDEEAIAPPGGRFASPRIETEDTDFGVRIYFIRDVGGDLMRMRLINYIVPNLTAAAGRPDGSYQVLWHVPIDDEHHWRYMIALNPTTPLAVEERELQARRTDIRPDYRLTRNRANRYLQDRDSMKQGSWSGLGPVFLPQDTCVVEGAGPIQDRTQEQLGAGDRGIIATRRALLRAIRDVQAGRQPAGVVHDPASTWSPEVVTFGDVVLPRSAEWRPGPRAPSPASR